jgi:hypothetical protein
VFDQKHEISQIIPVSKETIRVTYRDKIDYVRENNCSNIVASLFTTRFKIYVIIINYSFSIARLKLFTYLRKVERSPDCTILYVDTDSVLFKHPKGVQILTEGQFLGEMSREYVDFEIKEFIAGGPKYNHVFMNKFIIFSGNTL